MKPVAKSIRPTQDRLGDPVRAPQARQHRPHRPAQVVGRPVRQPDMPGPTDGCADRVLVDVPRADPLEHPPLARPRLKPPQHHGSGAADDRLGPDATEQDAAEVADAFPGVAADDLPDELFSRVRDGSGEPPSLAALVGLYNDMSDSRKADLLEAAHVIALAPRQTE